MNNENQINNNNNNKNSDYLNVKIEIMENNHITNQSINNIS